MSWKKRVPAYIIDILIVTIIINMFGLMFPKWGELNSKSEEEITNILITNEESKEHAPEELGILIDKVASSIKKYDKELVMYNGLEVMIIFGYFIILPYCFKGQTIGKKLMKIKITGIDKKIGYRNLIIRTLLITDLGALILSIIFVYILPAVPYFIFKDVINLSELILLIVCLITIIKDENNIGFHDKLAKTKVIESN